MFSVFHLTLVMSLLTLSQNICLECCLIKDNSQLLLVAYLFFKCVYCFVHLMNFEDLMNIFFAELSNVHIFWAKHSDVHTFCLKL
jgi:hypothetical protein